MSDSILYWQVLAQVTLGTDQPDYLLRALFFGGAVGLLICGPAAYWRNRLIRLKRESEVFHYFSELAEWGLAIGLSATAGLFDLYKRDSWVKPNPSLPGGFSVLCGVIAIYLVLKTVAAMAKKRDSDEISSLKKELAQERERTTVLEKQRNTWLELTTLIRKIIDRKMGRLVEKITGPQCVSPLEVLAAMDPKTQINLILTTTFQYFANKKSAQEQLRLGIYHRDPEQSNRLKRMYAWDGEKDTCFTGRVLEIATLDDPNGAQSQLAKLFLSPEKICILESCRESTKRGEFSFFPGQEQYLKSMVLFKHVFERNGTRDALILTLDSSQEGLFRESDREEITTFLVEMLKRVEYELSVSHAQQRCC